MTLENIALAAYLTGKLRKAVSDGDITDYNATDRNSQFGNYIYPDSPNIVKIIKNKNNFPRISIESVSQSADHRLGQMSDSYLMREIVRITCWTVRDLVCAIKNTSAEAQTYAIGTNIYELDNLPFSAISLVTGTFSGTPAHTFILDTDYQAKDNDGDGFNESIEWLGADLPDDATDFHVTYNRKAAGLELTRISILDINKYFRQNWRTNWSENVAFNYKLLSSTPVSIEEELGLYRWEMTAQFSLFDSTESV